MDVLGIIAEPGAPKDWLASYRPLTWIVQADSLVPPDQPMYADVYFGDPDVGIPFAYYKTFTSITIEQFGGFSMFTFDVKDALQEYLKFFIPSFNNTIAIQQSDVPLPLQLTQMIVYFRGSTIISGVLTPNPTVPIQGTSTTPPTSPYSGMPSSVFTVLDSTLNAYYLNISDNDLIDYLATKQVKDTATYFLPTTEIYPLSDLPFNKIDLHNFNLGDVKLAPYSYMDRQGMFPILVYFYGISGGLPIDVRNCSTYVFWGESGFFRYAVPILSSQVIPGTSTFYIPLGLLEMKFLMPALSYANLIDPSNESYYRVALYDEDAGKWCFWTPLYKVMASPIQVEVLWFKNNYGHLEQVSFQRTEVKFNTVSGEQFTSYDVFDAYNVSTIQGDLRVGRKRLNVRSYEEITLIGSFQEELMPWLEELLRSSYALQEMPKKKNFSFLFLVNQLFRQVKILDDSYKVKKVVTEAGIRYEVTIKIRPSIDNINLRN